MICGQCGTQVNDNCEFCPACGASLTLDDAPSTISVACVFCGAKIPEYTQYCRECGARQSKKSSGGKQVPRPGPTGVPGGASARSGGSSGGSRKEPPVSVYPDDGGETISGHTPNPSFRDPSMRPVQPSPYGATIYEGKRRKKRLPIILGIITALLFFAIVGFAYFGYYRYPVVYLNDYVSVQLKGHDGDGTATMVFNEDKFYSQYRGKIVYSGNKESIKNVSLRDEDGAVIFYTACVHGSFDKSTGLSNGDSITFKWRFDDNNARKNYKLRVDHSDFTVTVSGLKEDS